MELHKISDVTQRLCYYTICCAVGFVQIEPTISCSLGKNAFLYLVCVLIKVIS